MKVSLSWLKELVDIDLEITFLGNLLSIAGFEVEEIINQSDLFENVVVGRVSEISTHPNADKLSICSVDIGEDSNLQIVCGAKNVRDNAHVLVAKVGACLNNIDLKIKPSKIRGVDSSGMLCSLEELGVQEKSSGIAIIEDLKLPIPRIGSCAKELLGLNDSVIDLAITANRPDGMSMVGIAREVSAITSSKLHLPSHNLNDDSKLYDFENCDLRQNPSNNIYTITQIENVDGILKSHQEIKKRLEKAGLNSINSIVDITNYIMLEQGQPLHAFDGDKLNSIVGRVVNHTDFSVSYPDSPQDFMGINGNKYSLSTDCLVVKCDGHIIALAGVMGGCNSAVDDSTKRIWLEGAVFSPKAVRINSRICGVRTESSSRFEKGISSKITSHAIERSIILLEKYFKCNVQGKWVSEIVKDTKDFILLRKKRIDAILGQIKLDDDTNEHNVKEQEVDNNDTNTYHYIPENLIESCLEKLGCKLEHDQSNWKVYVPANRSTDLIREIDLIEEIARVIGYDRFDSNLPDPLEPGNLNSTQRIERKIRHYLSSSGLQEVTTFSLVGKGDILEERIAISNPLLTETSHLRTNLWEQHLQICKSNMSSGQKGCWMYELGSIYHFINGKINEKKLLCGILTGHRVLGKWTKNSKNKQLTYFEARGKLSQVFHTLKINIEDKPLTSNLLLHPGKSAELFLESKSIGFFGAIHPKISKANDLDNETYIFQLDLEKIILSATRKNKLIPIFKQYPTVPSIERDIALIIPNDVLCADIERIIMKNGKPLIESVELLDRYEGLTGCKEHHISLTFRITYRDSKSTLKDEDIQIIHKKIIEVLRKTFNAELRV